MQAGVSRRVVSAALNNNVNCRVSEKHVSR